MGAANALRGRKGGDETHMSRYILKRILLMIPVILGVIVLVFTLLYFSPGDATSIILGTEWTEEGAQALRQEMGLNDPYIVQLARYIWNAVRLDFGSSWVSGVPVAHELSSRIPRTLLIGSISIMITAACGMQPAQLLNQVGKLIAAIYPECDPALFTIYKRCGDYIKSRIL